MSGVAEDSNSHASGSFVMSNRRKKTTQLIPSLVNMVILKQLKKITKIPVMTTKEMKTIQEMVSVAL